MPTVEHGDFTSLAQSYRHRPAYSQPALLQILASLPTASKGPPQVVEVGAGTGKLTRMLLDEGLDVTAVEPNDAMRSEGIGYTEGYSGIRWSSGTGEATTLPDGCADWAVMASSFHWTDPARSLPELHRVLRPEGALTILWNPRDLAASPLQASVEARIREIVPELERVSSGAHKRTQDWRAILVSTGHFTDVDVVDEPFEVSMSRERYLGAWRSVNDIRVQAGEERFTTILAAIEEELGDRESVLVPYRTRAWTAQRLG